MNFEERMEELQAEIRVANDKYEIKRRELVQELKQQYPVCPICKEDSLDVFQDSDGDWDLFCNNDSCGFATPNCKTFHEIHTYLKALAAAKKKLEREQDAIH